MDKRCDLHIHSTYSDSDASIDDIFKAAQKKNLGCIALTDHDTIDGIEAAQAAGKEYGIELIDAMELSAQKNDVEIHILSYFMDTQNATLNKALTSIKELRKERILAMAEKLNSLGMNLDKDDIISRISGSIPTRLHLALYLVEKGVVKSLWEAFRKYLSPGKPAYVSRFKYSVEEAIKLIKECGGLAFIAHPNFLPDQSWIEEFVSYGLDGLEVVYPRVPEAKIYFYENLANKLGLLKSGGSDAHGTYKEFTQVGEVSIPYSWVEQMKQRVISRAKA